MESTLADLAASYAFGLAKNHAFVDGNKRAAFLSIGIFSHRRPQTGGRPVGRHPDHTRGGGGAIRMVILVLAAYLDEFYFEYF